MSFQKPDRETHNRIVDLLTPHVALDSNRVAIVSAAWAAAPNLVNMVNYSGAARVFAGNLVSTALRYGTFGDKHALLHLLDEVENWVGEGKKQDIAGLRATLAGEAAPPTSTPGGSAGAPGGTKQTFNMGNVSGETVNIGGTINIYGNPSGVASPSEVAPTPSPGRPGKVERDQVFISYSHKETEWMKELMVSLKLRMRQGAISVWNDEHIKAGDRWRTEIEDALAAARVAVLMVSRNFLASRFIMEQELPVILKAAEQEGVKIIWVPVTFSGVKHTEIAEFQAAGSPMLSPNTTLDSLSDADRNRAIEMVADEVVAAYQAFDA